MVTININDIVRIRLTQEGFELATRKHKEIYKKDPPPLPIDTDGWIKMSVWEAFGLFGPGTGMNRPALFTDIRTID